ncbi:hypothetical protein JAAARDRAFT_59490 [Jaapia argillacea MUCL 33604]|uniref:Ubinuclein middle domain-containing protein n=1 Tax=Jaapia argillacea MUCL 33604 TaxID=933084 RepID=A0A067PQE8_9AGAM|nr:hypothetical protein JAAARDRAFT_59490 [Jaapia argillacea MUCL 33604]
MDTDVEMSSSKEISENLRETSPSLASAPPATDSSAPNSPIPIDDSDVQSISGKSTDRRSSIVTVDEPNGDVAEKKPKSSASNTVAAATSASKPASTAHAPKPKSTKPPRPRSPSPTPPAPAPRLQTIRLDISLAGPEVYEVDVSKLAKATGQRPPTPPLPKIDTSDSEGDDEGSGKDKDKDAKPKKKRKRPTGAEYYDLNDPFIDDSDLALDQRTHFAQTKQQGFYVSSGEVALMKEKTPKKPKSKKISLLGVTALKRENPQNAVAGPSSISAPPLGSRHSPIAIGSDNEDDKNGLKRKASLMSVDISDGKKKRKTVEIRPFHPELEAAIQELKNAIANENWDVKGKFPPGIKPQLAQVALKAVVLGEYDDNFFNLMPRLFPYNKFTMTKLIKRTIFSDHIRILNERQDVLLQELAELTKVGFEKAQEEWEKSVVQWEKRQEKAKAEAEVSGEGTPAASAPPLPIQATPSGDGETADRETSAPKEPPPHGKEKEKEPHPPAKKYRLTDDMKALLWNLVMLSNECCRIENEKNVLENSPLQVSEQGLRKALYQKIVAAFPTGWMSSGQISREVSSLKKKIEKEEKEKEE